MHMSHELGHAVNVHHDYNYNPDRNAPLHDWRCYMINGTQLLRNRDMILDGNSFNLFCDYHRSQIRLRW